MDRLKLRPVVRVERLVAGGLDADVAFVTLDIDANGRVALFVGQSVPFTVEEEVPPAGGDGDRHVGDWPALVVSHVNGHVQGPQPLWRRELGLSGSYNGHQHDRGQNEGQDSAHYGPFSEREYRGYGPTVVCENERLCFISPLLAVCCTWLL